MIESAIAGRRDRREVSSEYREGRGLQQLHLKDSRERLLYKMLPDQQLRGAGMLPAVGFEGHALYMSE